MILNGDGRFVLLSKPVAFPFSDLVTGTGEGPVFDLSVDLEFYNGVGYIKAEHVEEMARTLGMEYKKEAEPESAEINHDLESLINGIDIVLRGYRPLADPDSGSSISVPPYLSDPEPESRKPDSADSSKSVESGNDSASGKDSKPPVGKGSAKLPSGGSDDFEF